MKVYMDFLAMRIEDLHAWIQTLLSMPDTLSSPSQMLMYCLICLTGLLFSAKSVINSVIQEHFENEHENFAIMHEPRCI